MTLKGTCLTSEFSTLVEGENYFLFPLGETHYYVSIFDSINSHRGAYQKEHFRVLSEEYPPEPPKGDYAYLDRSKVYQAELIWRTKGYASSAPLGTYFIEPRCTHCAFFKDIELKQCEGIFPLHWFANFKEAEQQSTVVEEKNTELPQDQWEQLSLF
ncbi:hypothetical protein RFN66_03545 [Bacillus paralicheniformis]|uniref:hypothetical protein n=1 Tax=Bacillus paralicheniformis TaxID=1648923 RepID=UPI002867B1EC|nr:hypothetical protein [Bacillus paralicheniformis]WMW48077.1 hypothetical protein RFN66_03545 [Bacillus paralicheniformis]